MKESFRFLAQREYSITKNYLQERFNYLLPSFLKLLTRSEKRFKKFTRIYAFSGHEIPRGLPIECIGLFIGTLERNEFRPSLEAAEIIGRNATKNFIEINEKEVEDWFNGKNLQRTREVGCYLIKYRNRFLGSGYSNGREIINYLPKVFAVKLSPSRFKKKRWREWIKKRKVIIENQDFLEYHRHLLEQEFGPFISALFTPKRTSIRVNTLKTTTNKLSKDIPVKTVSVPWSQNFFWIESSDWINDNLNYALGDYYVQEASSIIAVIALDPRPGERVLDLCAAPGSKTTQIAEYMKQRGAIVANDVEPERVKTLIANIQKYGVMNAIVTNLDGRQFPQYREKFNKILIDAPCSAVGTDLRAVHKWNRKIIERLSEFQKELIVAGFRALVKGGVMVYSTCTTSIEENEKVIEYLLDRFNGEIILEKVSIPGLKFIPGLTHKTKESIRVFSHHNNTENFFTTRMRKVK